MAYKHILIAVDLSPESKVLVEKAVSMARPYNAKISLIHVDVNYSDLYTGLIDVNLGDMQKRISEETHHALTELSTNAGYPITETLSGSGDLGQVLVDAIKKYDMDLVVCGHQDRVWSIVNQVGLNHQANSGYQQQRPLMWAFCLSPLLRSTQYIIPSHQT